MHDKLVHSIICRDKILIYYDNISIICFGLFVPDRLEEKIADVSKIVKYPGDLTSEFSHDKTNKLSFMLVVVYNYYK